MNKDLAIIGLTGQSGAGKSTASELFESFGISVIDCDRISHAVSAHPDFLAEVEQVFLGCTDENGLKRQKIAAIVFNDPEKLKAYTDIIYPHIKKEVFRQLEALQKSGEKLVILDAPTLFESGMDKICSEIVSVIAPLDLKIRRILERDGIPVELAQSRLTSQNSEKFFYDNSDYVIVNAGSFEELSEKVREIAKKLTEKYIK